MMKKIRVGLTARQVERSRARHGSNRMPEIKSDSWWSLWKQALNDRTLKILMGAAAVVIFVDIVQGGAFIEGIAILVAVALASLVGAWNDWRAQAEFKSLQTEQDALEVHVRRDGKVVLISSFDLVVGDIVEIEVGQKVPSDGILLEGVDIEVDESMLTGESLTVGKNVKDRVSAGTIITDGRGVMVVTAVGKNTEYGRLHAELGVPKEPTPLQQRLGRLANSIGMLGLGAAILIFTTLTIMFLFSGSFGFNLVAFRNILSFAVLAVTLVVVAVPEGLPLAVTLSLAYSVMKMARDKSLVRRLMACETMGAAEVICIDKTGTLTLNRMRVERAHFGNAAIGAAPTAGIIAPHIWIQELFAEISSVNSTAHINRADDQLRYIGSPTECALLELAESWGFSYDERRRNADVVSTKPFSSERKTMSTLVRKDDGVRLLCKGAAEIVLEQCTKILDLQGVVDLDDTKRAELNSLIEAWSKEALRPLALAYRNSPDESADIADLHGELALVALVGIGDPVRDEAAESIDRCRKAGVDVKIITGDALLTAQAIAKRIGALEPNSVVMEGKDLRALTDEELDRVIHHLRLVARAVPSDKLRVVQSLKRQGIVVAVTGDGMNDGPALKHADVGMAMGKSGTDVAREASDIIIMDDDLSSVFKALHWGRTIFSNIRSFLQFQLTVSIVAVSVAFIAALAGFGTPLGVMQLLWVNIIMDSVAALALSLGEPSPRSLTPKPHGHAEPIISRLMWINIGGVGLVMFAVLLAMLFSDMFLARSNPAHFTFFFNAFVLMQVFNMFNCRVIRLDHRVTEGLATARLFWLIIGIIVLSQVLIIQYGGAFFNTVPLGLAQWILCVVIASVVLPAGVIVRTLAGRISPRTQQMVIDAVVETCTGIAARVEIWARRPVEGAVATFLLPSAALTVVAGLTVNTLGGRWSWWGMSLFAAGIAAAACWLWERARIRPWQRLGYRVGVHLNTAIAAALAVGIMIQFNYIAARHFHRFDFTATRAFTLSPQTVSILSGLDHPVRFTTLLRPGSLADDVANLLEEYKAAGRHVEIQEINPDRDPGEVERLAERLEIKNPNLFSVIVEYRDRHRVVPGQELIERQYQYRGGKRFPVQGAPVLFRGEEALASALIVLSHEQTVKVCFLTGHGEREPDNFGSEGLSVIRDRLRREGFDTAAVRLFGGRDIPHDCQVAVQAGPQRQLSPMDQEAIESYLGRGGKWLITLEPGQTGAMDPLLNRWGLGVRPVYLIDPASSIAGVGPNTLVAANYQQHSITSGLFGMPLVFPHATSVHTVESARPMEGTNIVLTSRKGIGKVRSAVGPDGATSPQRDIHAQLAIAAAVNEPPDLYAADGRREPARIVAVGDTDFATNAHAHRSANIDFFINAIDWLARREELIGIRSRPAEQRRIHLSGNIQRTINWTVMGLVPGFVGIFGGIVAWRRRT